MNKIKRNSNRKIIKYLIFAILLFFAAIGLFLSLAFIAIKFKLTNDNGSIDFNDRYFQKSSEKFNSVDAKNDSIEVQKEIMLAKIIVINRYRPDNAAQILEALALNCPRKEICKMIDAIEIQLVDNKDFKIDIEQEIERASTFRTGIKGSVYEWMNIEEWQDFKIAVEKDKSLIDSVSTVTGVESRLIVSVLVGEQIRLFNSNREAYKKWIGPLKILSVEKTFSLGVTGIKENTAIFVEKNLKDTTSVYYLGKKCEALLDFQTSNHQYERYERLTTYKNHFYSYLYAALILKQVKMQWEKAGFPIDQRPEILATLFNIGFEMSVPKSQPRVGGSSVQVRANSYTFGAIAHQFYYSGDLLKIFPLTNNRFVW